MKHTRTTTKRILSVFLALLMIALSLPAAFAATTGITVSTNTLNISVGETGTITYSTTPAGQSVGLSIDSTSHISISQRETYVSVTGNSVGTDSFTLTMTYNGIKYTQPITVNVKAAATTHTVTYNYSANGGTSATKTSANVSQGNAIDLTPTATKSGWTFVGWNTNSNATTALSSLTMGSSNVTLYAIYKKTLTATFIDYNGTTKTTRTASVTIYNNATQGIITKPTQNTYTGWSKGGWTTSTNAAQIIEPDGSRLPGLGGDDETSLGSNQTYISANTTYYGVYYRIVTLSYNANDGSSTPASQSGTMYANSYDITATNNPTITLANAISRSGYTFDGWAAGSVSGTKFAAGSSVWISQNITMYATWVSNAPTTHTITYNYSANGGTSATKTTATVAEGAAIDLTPTATKSGWTFVGWNTNQNATTALSALNMGTSNVTLYAIFKQNINIYNMGEETYSFANYGDDHEPNGHCFGMSITSSAYYLGKLNITQTIGIASCDKLYTAPYNQTVRDPICYYQKKQGSAARGAIVAGGSYYKSGYTINKCNINSDWTELINYVKSHSYDNKGSLQIVFWGQYKYNGIKFGGHAVNFLYYKEVNGEQRIYVYDNNFPTTETYFYKASDGKIYQKPEKTLDVSVDSMSIHDVIKYYSSVENFNEARVIYSEQGNISISGVTASPMVSSLNGKQTYCYEIPENVGAIRITPLKDNADFSYLDEEYSFDTINNETYGELSLSASEVGAMVGGATFTVFNAPNDATNPNACKYCGEVHTGLFGWLIGLIHNILFSIFGAKK